MPTDAQRSLPARSCSSCWLPLLGPRRRSGRRPPSRRRARYVRARSTSASRPPLPPEHLAGRKPRQMTLAEAIETRCAATWPWRSSASGCARSTPAAAWPWRPSSRSSQAVGRPRPTRSAARHPRRRGGAARCVDSTRDCWDLPADPAAAHRHRAAPRLRQQPRPRARWAPRWRPEVFRIQPVAWGWSQPLLRDFSFSRPHPAGARAARRVRQRGGPRGGAAARAADGEGHRGRLLERWSRAGRPTR